MPKPPPTPPEPEEEDLRSRTDARTERKQSEELLLDLARRLVELNDRSLERLELPEEVLAIVRKARAVQKASSAKNRAMRLVRIALRGPDAVLIKKRLDRQHNPRPAPPSNAETWRTRLLAGGEPALDAFLVEFPGAERQRVRQLVRNTQKAQNAQRATAATDATRKERERALLSLIEDAVATKT